MVSTGLPGAAATPEAVPLDAAADVAVVGAKAAALARARAAGLPVLPGFVVPPAHAAAIALGEAVPAAVREAWARLGRDGSRALVVRSSSTHEDGADVSMAGRFDSVLDVRGWDAFLAGVARVVSSAARAGSDGLGAVGDVAVLVQPFVDAQLGGVCFDVDPVTGRRDRVVVAVVEGGPHRLVSGEVAGTHVVLTSRGRVVDVRGDVPDALDRPLRRALVALADRTAAVFGGPQDLEWAVTDGRLVLLQSRPVTALRAVTTGARGPVLGPGPVAETFPIPLTPLERDLWLDPLRTALREVMLLTGTASRRRVDASPLVVDVGGQVAIDLELLGLAPRRRRWFAALDPRPRVRRLRAAWRVGRMRAALPGLALDLADHVDAELARVPRLSTLPDAVLLELVERVRRLLVAVHGHEVLAGQLARAGDAPVTAAGAALRVLATAGPDAAEDTDALVARHPVLLSLVPPSIGDALVLPAPSTLPATVETVGEPPVRETLRLRARWLHELSARAALELGTRLAASDRIETPRSVRALRLDELRALVLGELTAVLDGSDERPAAEPLPARFRLDGDGAVVAVVEERPRGGSGALGAGGGRATGVVTPAGGLPSPGAVLVVRTLDPRLAPLLPGLRGLVAETGSVLSHLAIVARELGVPTVVGVAEALDRFPAGATVTVDGDAGVVTRHDLERATA
jgi:pyruvate,water dikinase